jgi:hypothetical protein
MCLFKKISESIVVFLCMYPQAAFTILAGSFKAGLGSQRVKVLGLTLALMFACCGPLSYIWFRIGTRKAAVLPEPVWAQAMRSRRDIMIGIAYFCTGVGLSYLANTILLEIISVICTSSNLKQNRKYVSVASTGVWYEGASHWNRISKNLSSISL